MFKTYEEDLFSFLLGEAALMLINEKIAVSLPNLIQQLRWMADNGQNEARTAACERAITEAGRYLLQFNPSILVMRDGPVLPVTRVTLH